MQSRGLRLGVNLARGRALLQRWLRRSAPADYWEERARRLGARSVVHVGHSADELAAVTARQQALLLPLLRERLRGDERWVLDLGCGPGRFSAALCEATGARTLGLDPTRGLLALAPRSPGTAWVRARSARLPLRDGCVDVAWVCLVLGGILDERELAESAAELRRVLAPGGLLFLVENTSQKPDGRHWRFRGVDAWREILAAPGLEHLTDYHDMGERNSVLCGRLP